MSVGVLDRLTLRDLGGTPPPTHTHTRGRSVGRPAPTAPPSVHTLPSAGNTHCTGADFWELLVLWVFSREKAATEPEGVMLGCL